MQIYLLNNNECLKSLLARSDALPAGVRKWNQKYDDLNWKYFENVFKPRSTDTQLRWFQVRLVHRILPTGKFLFLRKIRFTTLYLLQTGGGNHQSFDPGCTKSQSFCNTLQTFIKEKCVHSSNLEFSEKFYPIWCLT